MIFLLFFFFGKLSSFIHFALQGSIENSTINGVIITKKKENKTCMYAYNNNNGPVGPMFRLTVLLIDNIS